MYGDKKSGGICILVEAKTASRLSSRPHLSRHLPASTIVLTHFCIDKCYLQSNFPESKTTTYLQCTV